MDRETARAVELEVAGKASDNALPWRLDLLRDRRAVSWRPSCRDWVPQLVGLGGRYYRDQDFYSCWISRSSFDFFSRQ